MCNTITDNFILIQDNQITLYIYRNSVTFTGTTTNRYMIVKNKIKNC